MIPKSLLNIHMFVVFFKCALVSKIQFVVVLENERYREAKDVFKMHTNFIISSRLSNAMILHLLFSLATAA